MLGALQAPLENPLSRQRNVGFPIHLPCMTFDNIPARWYVSLVRQLMIEGVPLSYVWKEVCVLLFMAVILIGITSKIFKNRLE
jgi:hypothetical protein